MNASEMLHPYVTLLATVTRLGILGLMCRLVMVPLPPSLVTHISNRILLDSAVVGRRTWTSK